MFQSFGSFFIKDEKRWNDSDVLYWIQNYLQQHLKSDQIVCESFSNGIAHIRVGSPSLQQEVLLREYELRRNMLKETQFTLKKIQLVVG